MARVLEAKAVISAQDKTGGVFARIAGKIKGLERAAAMQRRVTPMLERGARAASAWSGGMMMAAGGLGAIGGAVVGAKIKDAVVDYAALERQMNRIGITAGATEQETTAATDGVKKMAEDMKMPLDQAIAGLDALVASGKTMGEAMGFLPSVLATAQAAGTATEDMAKSASALAVSLKVPAAEMQSAFDALVTGGKLGTFELKDMAQYLPLVAASAQKMGIVGVEGVQRLTAMLQVVRQVSGTSEQAANGVRDAFEKLLSPTVLTAAKKQGLDFKKIMLDAEKNGRNAFEAVIDKLRALTKGSTDLENDLRLSSIFSEADSRRAVAALIRNWSTYEGFLAEIRNSQGSVFKDLARVLKDSQAELDAAQIKFNNAALAVGQQVMPAVTQFLERADLEIQLFKQNMDSLDGWMKRNLGFGLSDMAKATGGGSNEDIKARIERNRQEKENPLQKRVNQLEDEKKRLQASFAGDQKHVDALKGYGYTPAQIAAEVPSYGVVKARLDAIERELAAARTAALIKSGGRFPADQSDRMAARDKVIAGPFPVPAPSEIRRTPYPVPAPAEIRGGRPIEAVVQGPVTATVTGEAQVKVDVSVTASPELRAIANFATEALRLRSAPTGRSMPEAEPPRGTMAGP